MLFVFRRSIYAHNTRTSRILSHRNNWYGDFGSLLSSNLFYYEKKDAVIKANCLFPVCRLCFSYQYCDLFRLGITCLLNGRAILATEHSLNLIPFRFITETWDMGVRKQITQTIANILMFLPLGFIFPVAFKKARTFYKTTICMLLFSFLIEFVQYFIGRSADIDDLILNTSGAMLGYFLFYKLSKLFRNKNIWKKLNGTAS